MTILKNSITNFKNSINNFKNLIKKVKPQWTICLDKKISKEFTIFKSKSIIFKRSQSTICSANVDKVEVCCDWPPICELYGVGMKIDHCLRFTRDIIVINLIYFPPDRPQME